MSCKSVSKRTVIGILNGYVWLFEWFVGSVLKAYKLVSLSLVSVNRDDGLFL